jgi:hypothetical protein
MATDCCLCNINENCAKFGHICFLKVAQTVSRWPFMQESLFRSQVSLCETPGAQNGTVNGFTATNSVFPLSVSFHQPVFSIFIYMLLLSEGQTGAALHRNVHIYTSTVLRGLKVFWRICSALYTTYPFWYGVCRDQTNYWGKQDGIWCIPWLVHRPCQGILYFQNGVWFHGTHVNIISFATLLYKGADKSLARPTSPFILFDCENISFDASLVIYINSSNIPPIMIINRIYEAQNLLSL